MNRPPIAVTITGADDLVSIGDLFFFADRFPFVEWGILISPKRQGTARYPSFHWLNALHDAWRARGKTDRFAAHFCGAATRDTIAGYATHLDAPYMEMFRRVQLNGYEPSSLAALLLGDFAKERDRWVEFILQARDESVLQKLALDAHDIGRASVLFDGSGGRGFSPEKWPSEPLSFNVPMGFAGGITPVNVRDVLAVVGGFKGMWIDMESGVRNAADQFDLVRVGEVLKAVADSGVVRS